MYKYLHQTIQKVAMKKFTIPANKSAVNLFLFKYCRSLRPSMQKVNIKPAPKATIKINKKFICL